MALSKIHEETKIFSLGSEKIDLGTPDSFRYKVLTFVLEEKYDLVLAELKLYLDADSVYPNFKERVIRFVNHASDLIYAIKAKRNFPGLNFLTRSKQQELREKYLQHFRELQITLKRIEKAETDLRLNDVKSTIYVIRTVWLSAFCIAVLAFALEIFRGLAWTSLVVFDEAYAKSIDYLFNLMGL